MRKHWRDITIGVLALGFLIYLFVSHERKQNAAINFLNNRQNQIIQILQGNSPQTKPQVKPKPGEKVDKK